MSSAFPNLGQLKDELHNTATSSGMDGLQRTGTESSLAAADGAAANNTTSRNKRYDRQLRIWGADGQARLESCKVCLLNSGPTGAETLKNLVLGGISGFTIVDGSKVEAADLGNNFMVGPDALGEPRAKVVTDLVTELNDAVAGSYLEEAPESLIERSPQFFAQFTIVVATQMREPEVLKLDALCREFNVILLVVRSYGLAGVLRASVAEHTIIESKPDNIVDDLRLHEPFPELQQFADSFDLSALDDVTLHHLPYVVLLVKAAQAWKAQHGGALPSTSKERSAFKELITDFKRKADELPIDSENFDEAVKAAFHTWSKYSIPSEVRALLEDEAASDEGLTASSPDFWFLVAALRLFVANEGGGRYLPLEGSIPDMHATTKLFLHTQRLYRAKADADVAAMQAHLAALLARHGRKPDSVPADRLRLVCKNARNLRLVRPRPLAQEYGAPSGLGSGGGGTAAAGVPVAVAGPPAGVAGSAAGAAGGGGPRSEVLVAALGSEGTSSTASLYVLLRAVDRFYASHGRYPGTAPETSLEEDVPGLKACAHAVLVEAGAGSATVHDDYVLEVVRFGASELHVVASIMGGMAAQEVIKLVTGQFTPVPGTLVFNGIGACTAVLEL